MNTIVLIHPKQSGKTSYKTWDEEPHLHSSDSPTFLAYNKYNSHFEASNEYNIPFLSSHCCPLLIALGCKLLTNTTFQLFSTHYLLLLGLPCIIYLKIIGLPTLTFSFDSIPYFIFILYKSLLFLFDNSSCFKWLILLLHRFVCIFLRQWWNVS